MGLLDPRPSPRLGTAVLAAILLGSFARLLGPSALLLAPLARAEDAAKAGGAPRLHSGDFRGPESCAACHPRHYLEWRGSAHAYATVDPIFLACNRLAHEETRGEIGGFCIACHATLIARTGELAADFSAADLERAPDILRRGVSCEVCHRMRPPSEGRAVGNASFELNDGEVFYGRLRGPADTAAHGSEESAFHGQSLLCGSCHDVLHRDSAHGEGAEALERSFVEWSASVHRRERGLECQDCHMLRYSGQAALGGPFRETLRRHNFPAVTVPLIPFPNRGYQTEEVQRFLRTAARVAVLLPPAAEAGAELPVTVLVKNTGAGHNLPSGISTFREMWLEVTVAGEDGSILFRSGHLDGNGDLMGGRSALAPRADPHLVSFSDRFLDAEGKEVLFLWEAVRHDERSLRPLEERSATYRVVIPAALAGSAVRVEVRLLFRFFSPYGLRAFRLGELAEKLPVWEMDAYRSEPIPVVRARPRPDPHVFPRDFAASESPSLQAALDSLQHGDRLLVAPGEHVLPAPLDFRGKGVRVESAAGPERTVLRLAPPPGASAGSVVVFRGGEGPEARLEGFTLTGGTGTEVGGLRRGGGVYVSRSSPALLGNRITANGADVGGGICVEGGSPRIEGNEILGNGARLGGGVALSSAEAGAPALTGNSLQGNVAALGGGVYLEHGTEARLERSVLAGNLAWEEGGAVYAAGGASLSIDRSTLFRNQALRGARPGAAGGEGLLEVTGSILAENGPLPARARLFYNLLDQDAALGAAAARAGNRAGDPLFVDQGARWEPAPAPAGFPEPREWPGKWIGGNYNLFPGSAAVDAGDPRAPADPDDTRRDVGALYLERPLKAFIRGDADGDGRIRAPDLLLLARRLARLADLPCEDAADLDDSGRATPLDAVLLAIHLLTGAAAPAPPYPDCGLDPTFGEGLPCDRKAAPCLDSEREP